MISTKDFFLVVKNLFFDKKRAFLFTVFTIISAAISTLFPLVTQTYIRFLFPERNVKLLFLVTGLFILLFVFKYFIDVYLRKYYNKLFLKLEKNLQEKLYYHHRGKGRGDYLRWFLILQRSVNLYVTFARKAVYQNFVSLVKIISIFILILFFNDKLFYYSLWFIPVFFLYTILFLRRMKKHKKGLQELIKGERTSYLPVLINRISNDPWNDKAFRRLQGLDFQRRLRNRNSLVKLDVFLNSSITFYRLLFLTYFGYFIINGSMNLGRLIVGLLYITILARASINIFQNLIFFIISEPSIKKIHKAVFSKN